MRRSLVLVILILVSLSLLSAATVAPQQEQKSFALTGTVTDTQGQPVAGVPLTLYMPVDQARETHDEVRVVLTDDHGRFTAKGLPRGHGMLGISGECLEWMMDEPVEFTLPTAAPVTVKVRRVPLCTVTGRVVDRHQQPLRDVSVVVNINDDMHKSYTKQTAVTADDGTYRLEKLFPGVRVSLLSLRKAGYRQTGGSLSVIAGQGNPDELVMSACTVSVQGVVRTAEGAPVPDAVVVSAEGGLEQRVSSDATGAFTLTQQPEGETLQLVAASATGGGVATVSDITQRVTITFTPALQAKPEDVQLALSLLAADEQLPLEKRLYRRSDVIRAIADVDLPLALKMAAAPDAHPSQGLRAYLLGELAATNPEEAARVGVAQLDLITDDACRLYAAVELGLAMVQRAPNLSEHCYTLAKSSYEQMKHDGETFNNIEGLGLLENIDVRIVSLAGTLGKTADLDAILSQLNARITQDQKGIYSITKSLLAAAGRVSPEFVFTVYDRIKAPNKGSQLGGALIGMAETHPRELPRLVEMIAFRVPELDGIPQDDLLQAINALGKVDPTAARSLAEILPIYHTEALLVAARYLPKEEAAKIVHDCFADAENRTCGNFVRAIGADPQFAAQLYAQYHEAFAADHARDRVIDSGAPNVEVLGFAVLLSYLDPREARLMMETEYARDRAAIQDKRAEGQLFIFPLAMFTVDPTRAQAILDILPANKEYRTFFGQFTMRYLLMSRAERAVSSLF